MANPNALQQLIQKYESDEFSNVEIREVYNNDPVIRGKLSESGVRRITKQDIRKAIERFRNNKKIKSTEEFYEGRPPKKRFKGKLTAADTNAWLSEMRRSDDDDDTSSDDSVSDDYMTMTKAQLAKMLAHTAKKNQKLKNENQKLHVSRADTLMQAMGIERGSGKTIIEKIDRMQDEIVEIKQHLLMLTESSQQQCGVEVERIASRFIANDSQDPLNKYTDDLKRKVALINQLTKHVVEAIGPSVKNLQESRRQVDNNTEQYAELLSRFYGEAHEIAVNVMSFIDKFLLRNKIKEKEIVIRRENSSSQSYCPIFYERTTIRFDQIQFEGVCGLPSLNTLVDNNVELCECRFEVTSDENIADEQITSGVLHIIIDVKQIFTILTDIDWRPPVTIFQNPAIGDLGLLNPAIFSKRLLYLLRFLLHSFVHIFAAISPKIRNPSFDHPKSPFFEEILLYFEPKFVLLE